MIAQEQINEIISKIIQQFKPEKIILFGSYANGKPTEESDLDLLIIKDSDLSSRVQNRMVRNLVADSRVPVDIIVKTKQEFEIYKDIIGTVIYPANKFGKVVYDSK
jgi:predicted nucleotidyltransferase